MIVDYITWRVGYAGPRPQHGRYRADVELGRARAPREHQQRCAHVANTTTQPAVNAIVAHHGGRLKSRCLHHVRLFVCQSKVMTASRSNLAPRTCSWRTHAHWAEKGRHQLPPGHCRLRREGSCVPSQSRQPHPLVPESPPTHLSRCRRHHQAMAIVRAAAACLPACPPACLPVCLPARLPARLLAHHVAAFERPTVWCCCRACGPCIAVPGMHGHGPAIAGPIAPSPIGLLCWPPALCCRCAARSRTA